MLNPEIPLNERLTDRIGKNGALASLADAVQPAVRAWRDGNVALKDILSGTILGHPLHPTLTDVPVGAWTVTALLDAIELGGGPDVAFAADASLMLGLAGAAGAAATGLSDWSDTKGAPKSVGMLHALLNGAATLAYTASFVLRRMGRRRAGIASALTGYGIASFSAYLGGELSYNFQLGVKHTGSPAIPGDDFQAVLPAGELAAGAMRRIEVNGIGVLLARLDDGVHAIAAACTHRGGPLQEGTLADGCVRCPWHGSVFSIADGSVREGPACFPQARFEARINGDAIEVRPFHVA